MITNAEHASLALPWFVLEKEKGIVVKYIELDKNLELTMDNVMSAVTNKTKVIALAHVTNVMGDVRPIKRNN